MPRKKILNEILFIMCIKEDLCVNLNDTAHITGISAYNEKLCIGYKPRIVGEFDIVNRSQPKVIMALPK